MATRSNVRAAIYCRISKDTEDTRLGVERQEQDCRKLCTDRGWSVAGVYCDNDISAADPKKKRPEYERLLKDIATGQVNAVAVYSEDRLHRRPSELESFVTACDTAGLTQLASVSGDINLNDPDALMLLRMKGAMAAREVAVLQTRIKRKMLQKAEAGEFHGGRRPFGFHSNGVEINEAEARLIREAAQRILEGGSLRAIAKSWNERGIRTTWDKPINETGLKKMLCSGRVAGLSEHHGDIVGPAKWDAILDEATWQQVRIILDDPARRGPRPSRVYPLRGVLKCGKCGHWLAANPSNTGARRYACKSSRGGCGKLNITADHVEQYVVDLILPLADMPDVREALRAEDAESAQAAQEMVLLIANENRKLSDIDEMYANDEMSRESYIKQAKIIRDHLGTYESRLSTFQGRTALSHYAGEVQSSWKDMPADDQRSILLSVLEYIEVRPVVRFGSNKFDPNRLRFKFRKSVDIENVHVALTVQRAQYKYVQEHQERSRKRILAEGGVPGLVGFDGFLEDLPPSPYDGIDPESDLGLTIPDA